MTEPILNHVRIILESKLADLACSDTRLTSGYVMMLADDIARNIVQAFMPTLGAYAEACALLDQTLALLDLRDFRSPEDQAKIRHAQEFLGGHP